MEATTDRLIQLCKFNLHLVAPESNRCPRPLRSVPFYYMLPHTLTFSWTPFMIWVSKITGIFHSSFLWHFTQFMEDKQSHKGQVLTKAYL